MAYRVEYARSGRSACKGPIPCKGTKIDKNGLRLGTVIEIRGDRSLVWRHWGCVTEKIISNLRENIGDPEDLDGIEDLNEEDKQRISNAFANGHVAEEDVTPALIEAGKGPDGTPSSSPQKKARGKNKAKKEEFDEEEEAEWKAEESEEDVKPKKKKNGRANTKVKNEEVEADEPEEETKPKKKNGRANAKVKNEEDEPLPIVPVKRGRSKAVKEEENDIHVEQAPKKRGRAAKTEKSDADATSVAVKEEKEDVEIDEKPKKKRSRPSGTNGAEPMTDAPSSKASKTNGQKTVEPMKAPEKKRRGRQARGAAKVEEESVPAMEQASPELEEPNTGEAIPTPKEQNGRKRGRKAK